MFSAHRLHIAAEVRPSASASTKWIDDPRCSLVRRSSRARLGDRLRHHAQPKAQPRAKKAHRAGNTGKLQAGSPKGLTLLFLPTAKARVRQKAEADGV